MTRTDRLLAVIQAELERQRPSLDAVDCVQKVIVTVKMNDGGYPRVVFMDRESMVDLTSFRK